jgi:fructokinase
MKKYTIVGIGELLFDVFPDRKALGGAPTNFAFHCQQLGHEAISVSAIGHDALGEEIKAELQARQLPAILQETDYPTGTVQVTLSATGSPTYEISEDVAWDHIAFTDELRALAQRTDAVCFGSLAQRHEASRTAILSFLKAMPEGSLRIFDINLRLQYYTRETIHTSLEHADILKLNDEEVPIVARLLGLEGDMEAVCRQVLTDYSLRAVILTRGADGCLIYHEKGSIFHPSACIKVADTVGAGDSFTAGFVSALLAGRSHLEAVALATRVAAFVCSHHGAMPTLPSEYRVVEA